MVSTKQFKSKLSQATSLHQVLPRPRHSSTRAIRWSIIATLAILAIGILVAVFPERRSSNTNTRNAGAANGLSAYDRLEEPTVPGDQLPKTVGYDGVLRHVSQSALTIELSEGRFVTAALRASTSYEERKDLAQPVSAQFSDLEPGQSVSILGEPANGAQDCYAQKVIIFER